MTTSIEISESVRHYYGQVLQSSNDLKTGACCSIDAMPSYLKALLAGLHPVRVCGNTADMLAASRYGDHFQVLGDKSRHFGLFDCSPGSNSETAKADSACC